MNGRENHRVEATLHFLERCEREGGRSIPLRHSRHPPISTAGKTRRDSRFPRVEAATVDSSSFREWLHVRCGSRAKGRREREIFLWNLEGNSPYPEENSFSFLAAFHIPCFFHRFFPLHSAVLNRYVPFIRCLRASLFFLSFFFFFFSPPSSAFAPPPRDSFSVLESDSLRSRFGE